MEKNVGEYVEKYAVPVPEQEQEDWEKPEVETKKEKHAGGRPRKKIDVKKIFELREKGRSIREIGKELNISHSSVRRELNKLKEQQDSSK